MNFIFDIGDVLVDLESERFLHTILGSSDDVKKVREIVFSSKEWVALDAGTMTIKEATTNMCAREPAYAPYIQKMMESLKKMLSPKAKTVEVLPKIKAAGHKLYYLSNYHEELSRYILAQYPFFALFEGGVFSCDVHLLKPSPEIYLCLLDHYHLDPHDCVFFDDTEKNVIAAEKLGIKGVQFKDATQLYSFI